MVVLVESPTCSARRSITRSAHLYGDLESGLYVCKARTLVNPWSLCSQCVALASLATVFAMIGILTGCVWGAGELQRRRRLRYLSVPATNTRLPIRAHGLTMHALTRSLRLVHRQQRQDAEYLLHTTTAQGVDAVADDDRTYTPHATM